MLDIRRTKDQGAIATDHMGFPLRSYELEQIISICQEIIDKKAEDQLEQEYLDFFERVYPRMYEQCVDSLVRARRKALALEKQSTGKGGAA